jgi:CheY-like chemotaxis protein
LHIATPQNGRTACKAEVRVDIEVGDRLGRYRLDGCLGVGGMGKVFSAWDALLRRRVAIKVLNREDAPETIDEARAMAAVRHPNVVTVYSIEEDDSRWFMVMERIEGTSLDSVLTQRGPLDPSEVVEIVRGAASALVEIHRVGLVHGDVKPSNFMIERPSGRIVLTDFGLAVGVDRANDLTTVRGTPEYICPERACGLEVSREMRSRQDVYALACTAFELLTGRPPFEGTGPERVLLSQVHAPIPRASDRTADLPWRIDAALRAALAKDPALRTATPIQLAADLEHAVARGHATPRILIVEDDPFERQLLSETLAKRMRGAVFLSASDGESAYPAAVAQRPDLVIADLNMPRMNGVELVATLRATPELETVPIVVLSGEINGAERRVLNGMGVTECLEKPLRAHAVVEVICRALALDPSSPIDTRTIPRPRYSEERTFRSMRPAR